MIIRPQSGPQEKALSCPADIIILGGAKGGGKSWAVRLATCRYLNVPGFHAVIFRREKEQVTKPGGQWDKSYELYPYLSGVDRRSELRWYFPSSATATFSHLNKDSDWLAWQGTETALFCFDQLEEFTKNQFLKILGCLRTTSGVPTQIVASCNPDAESWLAELVAPWIAADGYVDLEQDGAIKYVTVKEDEFVWVDADWRDANDRPAKSIAYFSADIWDNQILLDTDPNYLSNLMSQSMVDRERYLGQRGRGGNWRVKPAAGNVFRDEWWELYQLLPEITRYSGRFVRFWDFAGTEKKRSDWTAGTLFWWNSEQGWGIVADVVRDRYTPQRLDQQLLQTAATDPPQTLIGWWQDPAQAGVYQSQALMTLLQGYLTQPVLARMSKMIYANPVSRAMEQRKIKVVGQEDRGWYPAWRSEVNGYPDAEYDDQVDSLSGAYGVATGMLAQSFGTSNYEG